jgi:hypothetical protein
MRRQPPTAGAYHLWPRRESGSSVASRREALLQRVAKRGTFQAWPNAISTRQLRPSSGSSIRYSAETSPATGGRTVNVGPGAVEAPSRPTSAFAAGHAAAPSRRPPRCRVRMRRSATRVRLLAVRQPQRRNSPVDDPRRGSRVRPKPDNLRARRLPSRSRRLMDVLGMEAHSPADEGPNRPEKTDWVNAHHLEACLGHRRS